MAPSVARPHQAQADPYDLLRETWLLPQQRARDFEPLRERVHTFFEGAQQEFDRNAYHQILDDFLSQFVQRCIFERFAESFDLCALEYRTLAPRIVGEAVHPEGLVFLLGSKDIPEPELENVLAVMQAAYGREELTFLSLIPPQLGWLQVVYHATEQRPEPAPVKHTVDIAIADVLEWLLREHGSRWFEIYRDEQQRGRIRSDLTSRLRAPTERALASAAAAKSIRLPAASRQRLVRMVVSTPFMSLTRFTDTKASLRSILYFPAYLHDERVGGMVLMGSQRLEDTDLLDALYIASQILLTHLRLVEFPEEVRLAEREVLFRQFIRRFRHNMMHPLGSLMEATQRFKDSFQQYLVIFERGIDAWQPDLLPNRIVSFLNYIADEFRTEDRPELIPGAAASANSEEAMDGLAVTVSGTERIESFDRSIVAEVLRNLLTNSVRYARGYGLQRVEIDAGESGPRIVYREIGGRGLPSLISDNPWRLHTRDPAAEESSGQGLFLAKKFMEIHGGDISYSKDEAGGCRFDLLLRKEGLS